MSPSLLLRLTVEVATGRQQEHSRPRPCCSPHHSKRRRCCRRRRRLAAVERLPRRLAAPLALVIRAAIESQSAAPSRR